MIYNVRTYYIKKPNIKIENHSSFKKIEIRFYGASTYQRDRFIIALIPFVRSTFGANGVKYMKTSLLFPPPWLQNRWNT